MRISKNKIRVIPRIKGGIGNQLFIYAASRRLALANDAELVLDDRSGFIFDFDYRRSYQLDHFNIISRKANFLERLEPFSRPRRLILRAFNRVLPLESRSYYDQVGNHFDLSFLNLHLKNDFYMEGYFQSENYFKDIESTIREDLKITPPEDLINQQMALKIKSCESVAIHVRYFDAPQGQSINNVPSTYYLTAIEKISKIYPKLHYFIFSDKPEFARAMLELPDDRVTYVSHNRGDEHAHADLWLMTLCNHFIIANSTFSWWGAWLSNAPGKIVIAPSFNLDGALTSWGFDGLLPKEWWTL